VGRVGNRYVWQGGQTENQGHRVGKRKNFFGASRRILPTLALNPAGAPGERKRLIQKLLLVSDETFKNAPQINI